MAVIGFVLVATVVLLAVFSTWVTPYDYRVTNARNRLQPPSASHLIGTDHLGRDLLTRVIHGGRISLQIGLFAVLIATGVGAFVGLVSGYFGGRLDSALMRMTDVFMSIPGFYLILLITGVFGASTRNTMLVIGFVGWPMCARIVRGETLSLKNSEFISAAVSQGASSVRIIIRHVLPNVVAPLVVFATLFAAHAIITEAGLSFLGLGAQPPEPSWGNILSEGRGVIYMAWWVATFPGIMILMTVLGLNFMGDGLRDALDPKLGE